MTGKSPQNDIFARKHFLFSNSRNPPKTTFFDPILPAWILYCFFFFTTSYYLFLPLNLPKTTSLYDWKISPKRHFCTKAFFVFKSRNPPQNDIFRSNFGSKFGLSWRSLRFAALRCCSYKVHYVNMVYGLKCCLKFWYNSCIFFENIFNGRSDRTEDRLGRVCFLGQCHLTFIWEEQKIFWSFLYSSESNRNVEMYCFICFFHQNMGV